MRKSWREAKGEQMGKDPATVEAVDGKEVESAEEERGLQKTV